MAVSTVAFRYAKSLLDLAREKDLVEVVYGDMLFFRQTIAQNRLLGLVMQNPVVRAEKKAAIVNAVFGGKVNPMTMSFFDIIARKNREAIIDPIAEEYVRLYNQDKGVQMATITTTMPLTETLRDQIKATVLKTTGAKSVELLEKIDPALIGGYVLRMDDEQLDASLRARLNQVRMQLN
jgi:F-type H+-transporting ATPase subunit delta